MLCFSVEVQADSPISAAELVLRRLMERHLLPSDFAKDLTVDIITTERKIVALEEVEKRLRDQAA